MPTEYCLPPLRDIALPDGCHFPTRMQAMIFRNWELMPAGRIAEVLRTDEATVAALAAEMGLPPQGDVSSWLTRGYITIIKQNWQLLPYEQLLQLLSWDEATLAYVLREDDFFGEKLGNFKPVCEPILYAPLTAEQQAETAAIAETVAALYGQPQRAAFAFFAPETAAVPAELTVINESGFARSERFAAQFAERVGKAGDGYTLLLRRMTADKPETHRLTVKGKTLTVEAADEAGLLQGLTWLAERLCTGRLTDGQRLRRPRFATRLIYSYHGLYGNVFDEAPEVSFSDAMLAEYARLGINGIWAQGVLYKLVEFPFEPSLSAGWQQRQNNLRRLVAKAADYGIKVYLYLNEPRSMPLAFFEKYPQLKGQTEGDYAALCTAVPEVQQYLTDAVTALCKAVPGLGGFFTITMSENLTNCWSRTYGRETACPRCAGRGVATTVAEVNRLIYEAATAVDPQLQVWAWTWGWNGAYGFDHADCLRQLPAGVAVMNVSEEAMPFTLDGVDGQIIDYTMSRPGPGPLARSVWDTAKAGGHPTAAKVQVNCTWECSTVPYIPVFGLVQQHIGRLSALGVDRLMLSWTLGGAPSPNIKIASAYFFDDDGDDMLTLLYGEHAETVRQASACFDQAFTQFPFCIDLLYRGPQFNAPANLLYAESSGMISTMTCFPYDDLKGWCGPYTTETLVRQFGKLADGWEQGLALLRQLPSCELTDVAEACGNLFRSSHNQMRYVQARERGDREEMRRLLDNEERIALSHYRLMLRQPMLGYEAANHYVYTPMMCLEKVLNCRKLKEIL